MPSQQPKSKYLILPRTDGKFIVFDPERSTARGTVLVRKTPEEALEAANTLLECMEGVEGEADPGGGSPPT